MSDPRLAEIDEILAKRFLDESRLAELVISIGSEPDGPHLLVRRYGPKKDVRVLGYVALALSRSAWSAAPSDNLHAVLDDLVGAVRGTSHQGTIVSTLNALQAFNTRDSLEPSEPRQQELLSAFLVECVNDSDIIVRSAALDLLVHLWEDGTLTRLLSRSAATPLRRSLRDLAVDDAESDLNGDLEAMKGFWEQS